MGLKTLTAVQKDPQHPRRPSWTHGKKEDFFQGKSTEADSSVHADRTAVVAPLQDANKLNPPPSVIMTAQNRLIELGFLAGPADGVWGTKSRAALRAFKIANGLAADDKWDDLVSGRLYSTQAARSPLPLATTR
jgi:peptidoglycan hydrolase-like protein with peptidoglycan-binding domain